MSPTAEGEAVLRPDSTYIDIEHDLDAEVVNLFGAYAAAGGMEPILSAKVDHYLASHVHDEAVLVVDLDIISSTYEGLRQALPETEVFYAVKANPAEEVIGRLEAHGSNFDVASPAEIDLCLNAGADPSRISYGNPIKKLRDIAYAYEKGVRLYAFDSEAELLKLAQAAPGAQVFCRLLMTDSAGADWPLSHKFGCPDEEAVRLLRRAADLGMDPIGVSFHVGSQQVYLAQWENAIARAARVFEALERSGIRLTLMNLGGGFPARYQRDVPALMEYGRIIRAAVEKEFGDDWPRLIIEPGRGLVGDAGVIQSEVVLISTKGSADSRRWVFLDIGKFSGLAETMDEAIKYRLRTAHDGTATGPVVIAGPTCDSADVLYDKADYHLPLALNIGDKVHILSTGAYTSSYSAVNFNGFPPLRTICL